MANASVVVPTAATDRRRVLDDMRPTPLAWVSRNRSKLSFRALLCGLVLRASAQDQALDSAVQFWAGGRLRSGGRRDKGWLLAMPLDERIRARAYANSASFSAPRMWATPFFA